MNFDRNSTKIIQSLENCGIPQYLESATFGIQQKLLLSFLEILKFLSTQFSVVHRGGVDIFWNSPLHLIDKQPDYFNWIMTVPLKRVENNHETMFLT